MSTPTDAPFSARIADFPHCFEPDGGPRAVAAVTQLCSQSPALASALQAEAPRRLIHGAFGGSPYLTDLASRDAERLARIINEPPEALFDAWTTALVEQMARSETPTSAKSSLRSYKTSVALLAALAELGGVWPVMTAANRLSLAADAATAAAVRWLFSAAAKRGQWRCDDAARPEVGSGYFLLAMGKLGAHELNYSSDVDFIVFFDRDRAEPRLAGNADVQSFFVRLTRELVLLMEERTQDGYVFRTDLRLRPDAGATQIALSTAAAHDYYENVGQNWERAAMIKARACAGDIVAGEEFLSELAPFVWRKYLDYAAIADIHAMKRQIHAHKGFDAVAVLGQNIKLGRGGIREIEFFAQTQQLIAGGRQPELRLRATLDALAALEARGWVKPSVSAELAAAYRFLRRTEHRLQMVGDEQTHDMPADEAGLDRFARFCEYEAGSALAADLTAALTTVERHYASLFEDAPPLTRADANMVFAGAADDPRTVEELKRLGYSQPSTVLSIVRGWHHGRSRAVRSPKSRERLTEVQPALIEALADTVDPDGAIAGFDRFLMQLPAGVQLFALLKANPALLTLIANIMGSAPRLARILSRRPRLLDAVLDPRVLGDATDGEAIEAMLAAEFAAARAAGDGDPTQDILDVARLAGHEQMFLIGVRVLTGTIDAADAGERFATLAERLIDGLLTETTRQMEVEHGRLAGGQAIVLAMGKLGGREMTAGSDVDLIVVYDCDAEAEQSDGARPLAPSHYYTRLTQRLINAISAPTAQGTLYEVDMRLRPSGQKGPVATRLSSFVEYHEREAWTWERLALTRARVIAGSAGLMRVVEDAIRDVLVRPRVESEVVAEVRDMRQRIAAEKGTYNVWDLKQARGGLVDLEFLAQHLQLVHAAAHPEVLDQTTLAAIDRLGRAGVLADADVRTLKSAGQMLHDLTQITRLCLDQPFEPDAAPAGLKALLATHVGATSFKDLENRLEAAQTAVYDAFERIVR